MAYRLLKELDKRKGETEEDRVLYVALTRASQKLIINGFAKPHEKDGWKTDRWLETLGEAAGVDLPEICDKAGEALIYQTKGGHAVRAWAVPQNLVLVSEAAKSEELKTPEPNVKPIYEPLPEPTSPPSIDDESPFDPRQHVSGAAGDIPPGVVGKMVHKAIALWTFPGDPALLNLLETAAFQEGLSTASQRNAAVHSSEKLLERLQESPLKLEIEDAEVRYHELPYYVPGEDRFAGQIDLLFKNKAGWQIVDFKTDAIYSGEELEKLVEKYKWQLQRYLKAIRGLTGEIATARICFLDAFGKVQLVPVANK